jgi:hypothetical protein
MLRLQEIVHKIEEASSVRFIAALLAVGLVTVAYDLREYRNFSTVEAMDAAQLGRRIAQGDGYTTLFVRPLSMYMIQKKQRDTPSNQPPGAAPDPARIRGAHPDIANPPVYPVLLAAFMKVLPFNFTASHNAQFWSSGGRFWRYQPDFLITLLNQVLFLAVVMLAFLWARRLFDPAVAWLSALLLLGTDELWRFSVSGLSTMLVMVIFMALVWCLTLLEAEVREPRRGQSALLALAVAAGVLTGLGGLTRYAFGWLLIPSLIFIAFFGGPRRAVLCVLALAGFAACMTPWMARNYALSGAAFGTATYHVLEGTGFYPGFRLERSLSPQIQFFLSSIWAKFFGNSRLLLDNFFAILGGGLTAAFFLVGLLVSFRSPAIRRMRYFLLVSLLLLMVVQVLGRTALAEDSPEINSENLLVLLLPLVIIYGASLFFTFLDQIVFPSLGLRSLAVGCFGMVASLPLLFTLCTHTSPLAYPPYHPLLIQQTAAWMQPNELIMSDIPWAVAWYGNRQCVWLTLSATPDPSGGASKENFFTINDNYKPIHALYLTQKTTDSRFVTDWIQSGDTSWGNFVVNTIIRKELPPDFPLRQMPTGYMPEQLFLSDWKRWR